MAIEKSLFNCQCGCGEPIPYSPRHRYPSRRPKFKHGHSHRNKFKLNRETIEMEYLSTGSGVKLARKYGISPVAVYNMLNKMKIPLLPKEYLDEHKTRTGREWELKCLKELLGSVDCSGEDWRSPFDIFWRDYRINVKVSNPIYAGKSKERVAWSFNTKAKDFVDVFLCIGLNEKEELEKLYWLPSSITKKQTTIRRNGNSKYEIYKTSFYEINHERQANGC